MERAQSVGIDLPLYWRTPKARSGSAITTPDSLRSAMVLLSAPPCGAEPATIGACGGDRHAPSMLQPCANRGKRPRPTSAGHPPIGGDFPISAGLILAKYVHVPVIGVDLEPTLLRREPAIDYRAHNKPALPEPECERLLVAALAGVTLHANRHAVTILLWLVSRLGSPLPAPIDQEPTLRRWIQRRRPAPVAQRRWTISFLDSGLL